MRRCIDYLQPDLTAWASSLKGAHDHTAIIPNGSACAQLGPILMPTGRGFCGTSRRRQDLRALSCTTEPALVRAFAEHRRRWRLPGLLLNPGPLREQLLLADLLRESVDGQTGE